MKISQHIHQRIRIKNTLITVIILAVLIILASVSRAYKTELDLSANNSNTLSSASQKILATLSEPITVTAYIKEPGLQQQLAQLLNRYRRFKDDISIQFIDPTQVPEKARELNIGPQGAIIVDYQGRTEKLLYLDESTLSNALLQLAHNKERWVTFLTGHGERSPVGRANFDLGLFGTQLANHKIKVQTLNLAQFSTIPDNSSLLIIATPAVALLAGELTIIKNYINNGGNLLLLSDPDNPYLESIEQHLGITKLPGIIVDSSSSLYGIDDPSFVLISQYSHHPVTTNFNSITVFPISSALSFDNDETEFETEVLLSTTQKSWSETGNISGKIGFDIDTQEQQGPLSLGYSLTRDFSDKPQQRIAVLGDGDFLSNAYLGNVGNAELGFRMINWLTHDDQFIEIPKKIAPGKSLTLSTTSVAIIGFGFLLILPLLLMIIGLLIWRRRKQQ